MNLNKIKNVQINIKHEREIKCLVLVMLFKYCSLYLYDLLACIPTLLWTNVAGIIMMIVFFGLIYIVHRKWGTYREKPIEWGNKKQYIWAVILLVATLIWYYLYVVRKYVQNDDLLYIEKKDGFLFFSMPFGWCLYYLIYYLIVAVTEEFVYRVFVQGNMCIIFGKISFIAPLLSALYFGICHHVQGNSMQVVVTFVYGLIIGYARYLFKNCTYLSAVIAHCLYDFLIVTV